MIATVRRDSSFVVLRQGLGSKTHLVEWEERMCSATDVCWGSTGNGCTRVFHRHESSDLTFLGQLLE